jgi:hypothetical protein
MKKKMFIKFIQNKLFFKLISYLIIPAKLNIAISYLLRIHFSLPLILRNLKKKKKKL